MFVLPNISHRLPDPGSFQRGRSLLCPSCTSHRALHPSLCCTRQWTMADGSHELNVRLRMHSSPTGLTGFPHHKSFVFSQDLSIWKREELSILALALLKSSESKWFTPFESVTPDFFSYFSVFSCFFLKGPEKLMRKQSCEIKHGKSAVLRQYQKAIKWKKSLIIFTFDDFISITSLFQYVSKTFLKLGVGHIGELKLWVVSKSLEHISTSIGSPSNATATFSLLKCNSKAGCCRNECRSWSDPWSC